MGGELKGKQNDIGMTKQQLEVLLASGPLNPDGVEDFDLTSQVVLTPGNIGALQAIIGGEKQNPPLPSFLKRHIEFMERIVNGEGA